MWKNGDLVQLKSGGPTMTVKKTMGSSIYCIWFSTEGVLQEAVFPPDLLVSALPPPPSWRKD